MNDFIWRLKHTLNDIKYWFFHRFHPKHRYNILKTKLEPAYYCFDTVILHAAFERFCEEYVHTREIVQLSMDVEAELDRLYVWWNFERKLQQKELEDTLHEWSLLWRDKGVNRFEPDEAERSMFKRYTELETEFKLLQDRNLESLIRLKNHVSW